MKPRIHHALGPARTRDSRGSVLIVVLWVCLGLVSLTLLFGQAMTFAFRAADNDLAGRQAEQAIEGAARYALYLLANLEEPGQLPLPDTYQNEAVELGDARYWIIGRASEDATGATAAYGLIDEASKINLNTASQSILEGLPNMTPELAAAIIDWRDEDDEATAGGAESSTYLLLNPAYECKNGRFESLDELLLLNGASEALVYGEDANRNGILDPNEDDGTETPPEDDGDGTLDPGLVEYLTLFTRESNQGSDGEQRVNVNQGGQELQTLLTDTFGESRANEIRARLGNGGNFRSVLEFYLRSGMTTDEFEQVGGNLTTSTNQFQEGLVNANTAPEAVLMCLPGIDEAKASQIVAERLTHATPPATLAWVADILGEEAAVQAGPHLTARTYQVTADVAAVGRHGRGYRRTAFVIDFSGDAPAILYRRDLGSLGWALPEAVYDLLALNSQSSR